MQKIYCTINRVGNEAEIMCVMCVHVSGRSVNGNECPLHVKAVTHWSFLLFTQSYFHIRSLIGKIQDFNVKNDQESSWGYNILPKMQMLLNKDFS